MNHDLKFQLFSGAIKNGRLQKYRTAGRAQYQDDKEYYQIELSMFPGYRYFMRKDPGSITNYTVFSKFNQKCGALKFQGPIGRAVLRTRMRNFLKIEFDLIEPIYMSLYPITKRKPFQKNISFNEV